MSRKFKFKSSKPKSKIKLFSYTDEFIDSDIVKGAHIELFYNRQMVLEGCEGVYEYSDDYIKLNLGKGALILCGSHFDIVTFENKTITVKGKISSVEFCV